MRSVLAKTGTNISSTRTNKLNCIPGGRVRARASSLELGREGSGRAMAITSPGLTRSPLLLHRQPGPASPTGRHWPTLHAQNYLWSENIIIQPAASLEKYTVKTNTIGRHGGGGLLTKIDWWLLDTKSL